MSSSISHSLVSARTNNSKKREQRLRDDQVEELREAFNLFDTAHSGIYKSFSIIVS